MTDTDPDSAADGKVDNMKLKAIEYVADETSAVQTFLNSTWITKDHTYTEEVYTGVFTGHQTVSQMQSRLGENLWNSSIAEQYFQRVRDSLNSTDTALNSISGTLKTARDYQVNWVGEKVTPESEEASWQAAR
jgi:hypothetical protein